MMLLSYLMTDIPNISGGKLSFTIYIDVNNLATQMGKDKIPYSQRLDRGFPVCVYGENEEAGSQ